MTDCFPSTTDWISSQSQSYIKTDGQSATLSWNKTLVWSLRSHFITVRQLRVCWCEAFSLTRGRVCRLQLLLALASAAIFGSESSGIRDHILLFQIRDFLFVAFYDSQGYGWRYSNPPPYTSLQGRLYSVSVSIVGYAYPRRRVVWHLSVNCVLSVATKRSTVPLLTT
jgi:hypothetical protein